MADRIWLQRDSEVTSAPLRELCSTIMQALAPLSMWVRKQPRMHGTWLLVVHFWNRLSQRLCLSFSVLLLTYTIRRSCGVLEESEIFPLSSNCCVLSTRSIKMFVIAVCMYFSNPKKYDSKY
jgi:hypothetical protein